MTDIHRAPPPRLEEVAEDVFAYVQPDGGWCVNNAGLLASGGRAALIDTAATEARARALRAATAQVATEVDLVINTHFHGDHTFGNGVFPAAVVIGHARTRTEMAAAGLHLTTLWPDVEWGRIDLTAPEVTFTDRLTVHVGEIPVELVHPGVAHTSNDVAAWLPVQRVLFVGDIVLSGVTPFCPMGSVAGTLDALRLLRGLGARTVVTGHGPVGGPELFDATEGYFLLLQELARDGLAAGLSPVDIARQADLGPYEDWLDAERLVPNLHRAVIEELAGAGADPVDLAAAFSEMIAFHGGLPACHA